MGSSEVLLKLGSVVLVTTEAAAAWLLRYVAKMAMEGLRALEGVRMLLRKLCLDLARVTGTGMRLFGGIVMVEVAKA